MTDLEQRAKNGDEDAFAQLVLDNQKRVYNQALRMVKHPSDAEDVAQEAFLNAWKGMDFFKGDCTFATWMHRLTQNAAIDFLRRRRAIQDEAVSLEDEEIVIHPVDPSPGPEESLERSERGDALRKGLDALTEEHRTVLELRAVDGLSYEEIGQILSLTPGTVKSRIARGRMALKKILAPDGNFSAFFSSVTVSGKIGGDRQ